MSTFLIVLILIASILMILAVLVQNPKSGMASNFGASNQVMGVRQTADFLEKFTWGAAVVILVLALVFTIFLKGGASEQKSNTDQKKVEQTEQTVSTETAANVEAPAAPAATEAQPAN